MAKYDATEIVLSLVYYSGGEYTPEEIIEIMEIIAIYDPAAATEKLSSAGLRIVPINEYRHDD